MSEITRLLDKCPVCSKPARELSAKTLEFKDNNCKIIKLECGHILVKKIPKHTPFDTLRSDDGKQPYAFQVEGMRFIESSLASNKGACVFDEMGLGKTIQVLGYLMFHPEMFPVIFVLKSGLKYQFQHEILRWLGNMYYAQVIASSNDYVIPQLKCYIVSYGMLVPITKRTKTGKTITQGFDISKLDHCKTVVLDECQQISNPEATRTQMVRRLVKDKQVIGTSGSPWKNRGSELYSILNMCNPLKFNNYQRFLNYWVDYYFDGASRKMGGIRKIAEFKEYTKDFVIRRERQEVMKELPLINRTMHFTELDKITQNEYDEEVSDFVKWWNDIVIGGEEESFETHSNLLAKYARMRHITGMAKVPATVEYVVDFIENNDRKFVVFVHHKDVGELIYRELIDKLPDIPILRLTGEMSSEARFETQQKFNEVKQCVMVASTLAAGEGLNLQTCSDCIIHERQWNPANEEQAEGRFIRIGQTAESVTGTYMTAAGTIDEFLGNMVENKRVQFHAAMNKGEMPVWNQTNLMKELAQTIVDNAKPSKVKQLTSMR